MTDKQKMTWFWIVIGIILFLLITGIVYYIGNNNIKAAYNSKAPIDNNPVHISKDPDNHEHALQKTEKVVSQADFDALQDKYSKLAHIKQSVNTKTETVYIHDSIFFHDSVKNEHMISVPKPFREVKHWHKISGTILKTGIVFDTTESTDSIHVGFGVAKDSTLWQKINIFKVKDIHCEVTNYNPDSRTIGMKSSNYSPKTPWYLSTVAKVLYGAGIGIYGYHQLTK